MNSTILSEDIKPISGMPVEKQIETMFEYIKYMQEQLNFWSSNRQKEYEKLRAQIEQS